MPNQPKTPGRTFRIPDDVSEALDACAKAEDLTATDALVRALREDMTRRGFLTPPSPPPG
jgi:hypothetical protein